MHEQTIPAFNTREDLQVNLSILSPKLGIIPAGKRDWWQLKGENHFQILCPHYQFSDR